MRDATTARLARIPYPYRAALAICSDLDETPDREVYFEIARFLNTTETTSMGPGVGLEVGNSIYFDMAPGQFAYWNTDDAGREMVRTLIRSGHIDCLHSYGDLATTRGHAGRALEELDRHGCRLPVWVDHSTAATNFGPDIMQGHGDQPGHPAYHADLTCAQGIEFVWTGRVTSVLGQDVRPRLGGLLQAAHPVASLRTAAKEASKGILARLGNDRYALHGPNKVLRPARLRDGRAVREFLRSNPHWGGVSCCDRGRDIAEVLTERMVRLLIERRGVCILYTHLGKIRDAAAPFDEPAREAFRRLRRARDAGLLLVTTTRRLLRYLHVRDSIRFQAMPIGEGTVIAIEFGQGSGGDATALQGITFSVPAARWVAIRLADGSDLPCKTAVRGGVTYGFVPWKPLEFPQ